MFEKLLKFSIVGATGFLVDFSLTWFFLEVVGLNEYVANALGFTIAAICNYTLNRTWTFRSTNPNLRGEFIRFFLVSIAGLGINSLVVLGYVELVGRALTIWGFEVPEFWIAKIIATVVVLFWNFFINNIFTFRNAG